MATDTQLKALGDVISEVASEQELHSSYTDADDDSTGEPSTQIGTCKNKFKCACCDEVCRPEHKINEYSLTVGCHQSEIMYLRSTVSFLLTYLNVNISLTNVIKSANRPMLPSNQSFNQAHPKGLLFRLCKLSARFVWSLPSSLTAKHESFPEALKASILTPTMMVR